jgi:hypothetical protein
MGSTHILVAAVVLGTGLVCLICGYFWGRSNVRSQIEDALDKARISADAREFSVREELDEKMVELAELRARAEEIPSLHQQIEQLQSERTHGSAGGRASASRTQNDMPDQKLPWSAHQPAPVPESTDKTIENLLKSIEDRMKQTEEDPPIAKEIPAVSIQAVATPPPTHFAVEIPPTVTRMSAKPAAPQPPAARPAPAAKDEWQEFAASLDALRNPRK